MEVNYSSPPLSFTFHNKLCPKLPNSQRCTVCKYYIHFCTKIKWKYCGKNLQPQSNQFLWQKPLTVFFCLCRNSRAAITGIKSIAYVTLHSNRWRCQIFCILRYHRQAAFKKSNMAANSVYKSHLFSWERINNFILVVKSLNLSLLHVPRKNYFDNVFWSAFGLQEEKRKPWGPSWT